MARRAKKTSVVDTVVESFVDTEISTVMRENYQDYAAAVVIGRAIPDIRDGLKPVHRRIIYAMMVGGYDWTTQHRKSARIVGDVIGKYHPHGDTAVYDAMTRLTQPWNVSFPLIDGQGNFGSPDGDNAAAMRYTEARLSKISKHLISEINRGTVAFKPNYDGQEQEPSVLPAAFPNILVTGGTGIAVGMASSIPPHNLTEILTLTLASIRNEVSTLDEAMQIVQGPDFPTQGRIIGDEGIRKAYETGRGTVQVEATAHYEMDGKTPVIIYSDMPYGVTKPSIIGRINELIGLGKTPEVLSARDESDRNGTRFVVELKPGTDQENTDLRLKSLTNLRTTISLNFTALDAYGVPREMPLLDIIDNWIIFRRDTVRKRSTFDLRKARERGRLMLGRIAALSVIDRIIRKIRESSDRQDAIAAICAMSFASEDFGEMITLLGTKEQKRGKRFNLTEFQAEDILAMRLQRLTGMERSSLEQEGLAIAVEIKRLQEILNSSVRLDALICEELELIRSEYPQERKTEIDSHGVIQKASSVLISEPRENCFVEINQQGLIQKRKKMPEPEELGQSIYYETHTHARLVVFTDLGTAYSVNTSDMPKFEERKEDPRSITGLVGQQLDGRPVKMMIMDEKDTKEPGDGGSILVFVTEDGYVRRTAASEFASIPSTGKMAMKIIGKDAPIKTVFELKSDEASSGLFMGTSNGKTIRFALEEVRVFNGRASRGVRGMKLDSGDIIVSAFPVPLSSDDAATCDALEDAWLKGKGEPAGELIQVASTGHLKRTTLHAYRQMKRDGKGMNDKGPAKTIGSVVAYQLVDASNSQVQVLNNDDEPVVIDIADIRRGGRASTGGKPLNAATGISV